MEFNTPEDFKQFIYTNICQCYNQCINMNTSTIIVEKTNCSEISINNMYPDTYYNELIDNSIAFFTKNNILYKVWNKYYIMINNKKVKLSWDNIKELESNNITELLWLFRKLVVDTLLKKALTQVPNVKIFSVGSTNITSDYDVTLYGSSKDKLKIIQLFDQEFKKIFIDDSSIVFDTNIYGKAFISFDKSEFGEGNFYQINCEQSSMKIYALKETKNQDSQLIWSLVKYITDLRIGLGEKIYNNLMDFMTKKLPNLPHISIAMKTRVYLTNVDENELNYISLFKQEDNIINKYQDRIFGISDFTSLINFFGKETYFSRGAFLDTVVYSQMCKDPVILSENDYICSILENAGFFLIHNNKLKYFTRVVKALNKLTIYQNYSKLNLSDQIKSRMSDIVSGGDAKYCKWVNTDDFNLQSCEKFELFNILFKIIYSILQIYNTNFHLTNERQLFPFYYTYIYPNIDISPSQQSPPLLF